MKRYECKDLFAVLGDLIEQHVRSYKTDFDIDKEIFEKALEGKEKDYLWFLRDTGTCCVEERAAYIDGTYGHAECSTFLYDSAKAYVVHVDGKEDGKVSGKVYPVDPKGLYEEIMKNTVAAHGVKLTLGDNTEMVVPYETYNGRASYYHREYDVVKKEYLLTEEDERKVSALLRERQDAREKAKEGDSQELVPTEKDRNVIGVTASGLAITSFTLEDCVYMANYEYKGEIGKSAVWSQYGQYYIRTGMAIEGNLERHDFTPEIAQIFEETTARLKVKEHVKEKGDSLNDMISKAETKRSGSTKEFCKEESIER